MASGEHDLMDILMQEESEQATVQPSLDDRLIQAPGYGQQSVGFTSSVSLSGHGTSMQPIPSPVSQQGRGYHPMSPNQVMQSGAMMPQADLMGSQQYGSYTDSSYQGYSTYPSQGRIPPASPGIDNYPSYNQNGSYMAGAGGNLPQYGSQSRPIGQHASQYSSSSTGFGGSYYPDGYQAMPPKSPAQMQGSYPGNIPSYQPMNSPSTGNFPSTYPSRSPISPVQTQMSAGAQAFFPSRSPVSQALHSPPGMAGNYTGRSPTSPMGQTGMPQSMMGMPNRSSTSPVSAMMPQSMYSMTQQYPSTTMTMSQQQQASCMYAAMRLEQMSSQYKMQVPTSTPGPSSARRTSYTGLQNHTPSKPPMPAKSPGRHSGQSSPRQASPPQSVKSPIHFQANKSPPFHPQRSPSASKPSSRPPPLSSVQNPSKQDKKVIPPASLNAAPTEPLEKSSMQKLQELGKKLTPSFAKELMGISKGTPKEPIVKQEQKAEGTLKEPFVEQEQKPDQEREEDKGSLEKGDGTKCESLGNKVTERNVMESQVVKKNAEVNAKSEMVVEKLETHASLDTKTIGEQSETSNVENETEEETSADEKCKDDTLAAQDADMAGNTSKESPDQVMETDEPNPQKMDTKGVAASDPVKASDVEKDSEKNPGNVPKDEKPQGKTKSANPSEEEHNKEDKPQEKDDNKSEEETDDESIPEAMDTTPEPGKDFGTQTDRAKPTTLHVGTSSKSGSTPTIQATVIAKGQTAHTNQQVLVAKTAGGQMYLIQGNVLIPVQNITVQQPKGEHGGKVITVNQGHGKTSQVVVGNLMHGLGNEIHSTKESSNTSKGTEATREHKEIDLACREESIKSPGGESDEDGPMSVVKTERAVPTSALRSPDKSPNKRAGSLEKKIDAIKAKLESSKNPSSPQTEVKKRIGRPPGSKDKQKRRSYRTHKKLMLENEEPEVSKTSKHRNEKQTKHGHSKTASTEGEASTSSKRPLTIDIPTVSKARPAPKKRKILPPPPSPSRILTIQPRGGVDGSKWCCAFCGKPSNSDFLGVLYGPYKAKLSRERRDLSRECRSPEKLLSPGGRRIPELPEELEGSDIELWMHKDCGVWSQGVYMLGRTVHGLEQAVETAATHNCSKCSELGATLACFRRGCNKIFHYACAKDSGCTFVEENFTIFCSSHKST
ncbi:chromodomain-helicase-DNA-binding protein 7-like [Nematostella vectensis]|uniref:chromodomain-helicase-DNA-binding protein 7-like n=1 Tax=Nematostella vectensis TaxID=45351 RepID=UPI0020770AD3|nr:chromodomain-helicase-DNA-binding protein 7-like [Nematostella vectensis]